MENKTETQKCCVVTCDLELGETYWNNQYNANAMGWDLGEVSPPLKAYIDQLQNKNLRILIPGCGNTYEAAYLLQQGFTDITVIDIAPTLVENLKQKFKGNKKISIIQGDFFAHTGEYDLILEQTFFCAIHPSLRQAYVAKANELLAADGKLVGVLFDKEFEHEGPPFGGCKCQYIPLFENYFRCKTFEPCYNSFIKRAGTELFIILSRR
ncbi:MAG TPA: methyltransferase domain-containing protein [Agriterribacter sp.]|nr:methyltransferase domain-containing protein [Agriterribacter sp.]